ncbi:hypothetical protein R7Q48_30320, partial [Vibrio sp. 378]|nr:hypothetical protein [Vibrio sp. 378]
AFKIEGLLVLHLATSSSSTEITFASVWLEHLHVKASFCGSISSLENHRFSARSAKFSFQKPFVLKGSKVRCFQVQRILVSVNHRNLVKC